MKYVYSFINQYGVHFTYSTGEDPNMTDLEFIKYCLDHDSILIKMEPSV